MLVLNGAANATGNAAAAKIKEKAKRFKRFTFQRPGSVGPLPGHALLLRSPVIAPAKRNSLLPVVA